MGKNVGLVPCWSQPLGGSGDMGTWWQGCWGGGTDAGAVSTGRPGGAWCQHPGEPPLPPTRSPTPKPFPGDSGCPGEMSQRGISPLTPLFPLQGLTGPQGSMGLPGPPGPPGLAVGIRRHPHPASCRSQYPCPELIFSCVPITGSSGCPRAARTSGERAFPTPHPTAGGVVGLLAAPYPRRAIRRGRAASRACRAGPAFRGRTASPGCPARW